MSRSDKRRHKNDKRATTARYLNQHGKPGWLDAIAKRMRGGERKSVRNQLREASKHTEVDIVDVTRRQPSFLDHFSRYVATDEAVTN